MIFMQTTVSRILMTAKTPMIMTTMTTRDITLTKTTTTAMIKDIKMTTTTRRRRRWLRRESRSLAPAESIY